MKQRSAFAKAADIENPVVAIRNVLKGDNPIRDYREIIRVTRRGGPEAIAGLRRATFDHLFEQATDPNGLISGAALRKSLRSGDNSLMNTMVDMKVLSPQQRRGLDKIIEEVERFETALASGQQIGDVLDDPSALEDLVTRIVGANIGGMSVISQSTGAPIVAAGAGSKFARIIAQKLPARRVKDILKEGIENPKFMATLLRKSSSPGLVGSFRRQINAFLLQSVIPQDE